MKLITEMITRVFFKGNEYLRLENGACWIQLNRWKSGEVCGAWNVDMMQAPFLEAHYRKALEQN